VRNKQCREVFRRAETEFWGRVNGQGVAAGTVTQSVPSLLMFLLDNASLDRSEKYFDG